MAWIELHQSVATHRKTLLVADTLDIAAPYAVGLVSTLWLWALDNAPDGNLGTLSPRLIARAAQWDGDPALFFSALVSAGFVDPTEQGHAIHHWQDYAGRLIERRQAEAERVRRYRESVKRDARTPDATRNERRMNAGTVPYRTLPYRTVDLEDLDPPVVVGEGGAGGNEASAAAAAASPTTAPPTPTPTIGKTDDAIIFADVARRLPRGKAARAMAVQLEVQLRQTYGDEWVDAAGENAIRLGKLDARGSPIIGYVDGTCRGWVDDGFQPPGDKPWEQRGRQAIPGGHSSHESDQRHTDRRLAGASPGRPRDRRVSEYANVPVTRIDTTPR